MKKFMCIVMGLVFLGLGFLGMTGIVPMFKNDQAYVNVGQIVLGFIGLTVGVYSRQNRENARQRKETDKLRKENDHNKRINIMRIVTS